ATMDIPAPQAGRIVELRVKVGDRVSEGSVVLTMEATGAAEAAPAPAPAAAPVAPAPAQAATAAPVTATGSAPARVDESCAVLVIGGG
ncbi:biotin/lipoyl-containing protein, partial [Burkholderia pseudomallei]